MRGQWIVNDDGSFEYHGLIFGTHTDVHFAGWSDR